MEIAISQSRGSEWRKWDLHTHTKDTNKNDNFKSSSFDEFCEIFFQKALLNGISAIGVTDYYSIDNYKKIFNYQLQINNNQKFELEEREKIKQIFILPNVELRMTPVTDTEQLINIHCIFNPDYIDEVTNAFFNELTFSLGNRQKFKMNKEGLIALGKEINKNLSDDDSKAYFEGMSNFIVSHEQLEDILNSNKKFRDNVIIVVSNSNKDGASGIQQHSKLFEENSGDLTALRQSIYRISDCIFSGNPKDNAYFLGKSVDKEEVVKSKCGSLKPCIHGSDAHTEEKLFTPDKDRYCWIKADLSFEGLKQVLYEPELRCKIQKDHPCEKKIFSIIKSVRFEGDLNFQKERIYLNKDMNTIIGGKSSGKSLLLHYTAYTINSKYAYQQLNYDDTKQKVKVNDEIKDDYEFSLNKNFDFIVEWEDGVEYKLSDSENEKQRPIVYIPQSYILNFTKGIEKSSRHKLGEFIRDILKQDTKCKNEYQLFVDRVKALDIIRDSAIDQYFLKQDEINKLKDDKKNIGDVIGINNQIVLLKKKIDSLKGNSIKDDQLNLYSLLNKRSSKLEKISTNISSDFEHYKNIIDKTSIALNEIKIMIEVSKKGTQSKYFTPFLEDLETSFNTLQGNINNNQNKAISVYDNCIERVAKMGISIDSEIKPLQELLHHKDEIISIEKEIKNEEKKLHEIQTIENKISNLLELQDEQRKIFFNGYENAYKEYELIIEKLNIGAINIPNLEIKGSIKYYYNRLRDKFYDYYDQRSSELKENKLLEEKDNKKLPDINFEEHFDEIKNIFSLIVKNKISLRKNKNNKDGVKALFQDNFFDYWEIFIGTDEMASMSPGQANLAILKLLIELSESNCPILIDQPEDNLDNRSIYGDLVQFIRKRKENRQVIIVTHNPNIVVGADSENIIVANQAGQDNQRDNKKHRFEYINGALEHTFLPKDDSVPILYRKGIREHVTEILEGGKEAFKKREEKYGFKNH